MKKWRMKETKKIIFRNLILIRPILFFQKNKYWICMKLQKVVNLVCNHYVNSLVESTEEYS